ncbi:MAG TPA: YfhO family protein [Patescibacteria group bacterium]|jgi:hypothetical protein|nr:YfhO family protein [Patescibacteria group bacterium]
MNKLRILLIAFFVLLTLVFFKALFLQGQSPIPADTIVGLYYPFRDLYFKTNPNGLPYKNFLITDPVRQQIPWKQLVIDAEKKFTLPIWNPYNFTGTPLLANFQSGVFYPFNLLFFLLPFSTAWGLIIFLQPLLAGLFLFFYLANLKLNKAASLLGAVAFAFCGFSIAWMEWGTILLTALWLPLILLSIDKIMSEENLRKFSIFKFQFSIWPAVFLFALVFAFFAGHLQTFFYLSIFTLVYSLLRFFQQGKRLKTLGLFIILTSLFLILTVVQWLPTLNFIALSARNVDLPGFTQAGWFIPWQNLIQFIAPDFFGNPATLNYYGIWNYGEFIGYVGIVPLVMAFYALIFRRDKNTFLFGLALFLSLVFALPTIFAKVPFKLDIPFLSTAQPTRLLFIADFSLSVLAAFGLDYFINSKNRKLIFYVLGIFGIALISFWSFVLIFHRQILLGQNLAIAKQNLILPTLLFVVALITLSVLALSSHKKLMAALVSLLILITVFDLFRFGWKFEPFTNKDYLFPSTAITSFLQNQPGPFRVMATDSRILPPNFSIMYKLQTLDGYDPLYLQRYGELMAASARGEPNISPPFGFNRIITPQDPLSRTTDLLGVKYVLSLEEIKNPKLTQVFTDGVVRIYENVTTFPRVFFVSTTFLANSKQQAINALFDVNFLLNKRAVVENVNDKQLFQSNWGLGKAVITDYQDNKVVISVNNPGVSFLVLTDSYYPSWHATIDGKETPVYLTDYNFRGIITPKGKHTIVFYDTLF